MPFYIVEELRTLPNIVLATVVEFLPAAFVRAITRSSDPELLEIAEYQQWRWVAVTGYGVGGVDDIIKRFSHVLTHQAFSEMVQEGTPPPRSIRHLFYAAPEQAGDDALYMTPEWCEYVATNVESMGLGFYAGDTNLLWDGVVTNFGRLNIVDIRMDTRTLDHAMWRAEPQAVGFPLTLKLLVVDTGGMYAEDLQWIALPESLQLLEITSSYSIHPSSLPELPVGLKSLVFTAPNGMDVSEVADVFPGGLEKLVFHTRSEPAVVSLEAAKKLPPGVLHNALVYLGSAMPKVRGLNVLFGGVAVVDLAVEAEYSEVVLPPNHELVVKCGLRGDMADAKVGLGNISHWFPQLRKLTLKVTTLLLNAGVPPGLVVEADGVRFIYRRLDPEDAFDGSGASSDPAWEWGDPESSSLVAALAMPKNEPFAGFSPEYELTSPVLRNDRLLQGYRFFDLVTELELLSVLLGIEFHLKYLPPNLVRLRVETHHFRDMGLCLLEDCSRENWNLTHLLLLKTLELFRLGGVCLGAIRFPDSVLEIRCRTCTHLDIEGMTLPPRLEHLEFNRCWLPDPWTTGLGKVAVYPESLQLLFLTNNRPLVPPPPGFAFPPGLVEMRVDHCDISDITHFRFPSSLERLDVRSNAFPIPPDYEWPRLRELVIDSHTPQPEQDLLERQIRGVRLSE